MACIVFDGPPSYLLASNTSNVPQHRSRKDGMNTRTAHRLTRIESEPWLPVIDREIILLGQ